MKTPTRVLFCVFVSVLVGFGPGAQTEAQELEIDRKSRAAQPAEPSSDPSWVELENGLVRAKYLVPPDFLHRDYGSADDPFDPDTRRETITAQKILEDAGVPFPDGASATYRRTDSTLIVENTAANMDLVEGFAISGIIDTVRQVNIRTEIYALPALQLLRVLESAAAEGDQTPERNAVLRFVKQGHGKLVATHSITTTAGQRSKVDDTTEVLVPEEVELPAEAEDDEGEGGVGPDEEAAAEVLVFDTRSYGTILEVEPNIDADGVTLSINIALEHHTAEPVFAELVEGIKSPAFHAKKIQTNCTLFAGDYTILGTWKPTGKPDYEQSDLRHLVFLTANIQAVGSIGKRVAPEE